MANPYDRKRAWALDLRRFDASTKAFRIPSKRTISMGPGHLVLAFERGHQGLHFPWYGTITTVAPDSEEVVEEGQPTTFIVHVSLSETFEDSRHLEDYTFSLLKVRRFDRPWRHFTWSYVSLDVFDFETLVRGSIFWARTAFGTFANALPNVKLFEYLQLAAEEQPTRVIKGGDMASAWRLLKDFIEDEYVAPADLFRESAESLLGLGQTLELPTFAEQFGVSDDGRSPDTLVAQSQRFDAFIESLQDASDGPVLRQFDGRLDHDGQSEARFEKRFAEVQWPLNVIANS